MKDNPSRSSLRIRMGRTDPIKERNSVDTEHSSMTGSVSMEYEDYSSTYNDLMYVKSPRKRDKVYSDIINIGRAPQAGGKPQINWLTVLITPLISVSLLLILVFVLGLSPIMLIMTGAMSVVSAITAATSYRKQKKEHDEKNILITSKYNEYLSEKENEIKKGHRIQRNALERENPSPLECLNIALDHDARLWEREAYDDDFVYARIGVGNIDALVSAKFSQPEIELEANTLEDNAKKLAAESKYLHNVPIICKIAEDKFVGICGERDAERRLIGNIIVELAALHSYDELKIVILASKAEIKRWEWARWLPHCSDNQKSTRYIFSSEEEADNGLADIEEELREREADSPHFLFIVFTKQWLEKSKLYKYLSSEECCGCSVIYAYDKYANLPKNCFSIIEVRENCGEMYYRNNSAKKVVFTLDEFSETDEERFARAIAPILMDLSDDNAELPRSISFLNGYKVQKIEELNIGQRWKTAAPYASLAVPVAMKAGGIPFELNIHEKAHGVHGLVVGTNGSGKTEAVQSWLLSLAVNYSPQDVSFVLIDFKGTGMIAPFHRIPHLAGAITNLSSTADINRSLEYLKTERIRREGLISKYSSMDITMDVNQLARLYAAGKVEEKLTHLIIVIDEYAEFKKRYPDFGVEIDSLVSTGRALGMFVVLMTQSPSGVVSKTAEDNISFRWCLRVANAQASREMIGTIDSAKIAKGMPGRAFIKIGEEVFEQIQSFYSGAVYDPEMKADKKPFVAISSVALNGNRTRLENEADVKRIKGNGKLKINMGRALREVSIIDEGTSEISAVVAYIADYCRNNGIPAADRIWSESLPERIAIGDLMTVGFDGQSWPTTEKTLPVVGLIDDPAEQRQYPMELDFAKLGHTAVYGAPVTGKTTMLQTLVMSLAMTRKPDEVSIYIIDFGGWNMSVLRELPHIGGIANDNEPERLKKLILLLTDMLQERKKQFSKVGVGNITAYREGTVEKIPDVFIMVDNFGAMIKMYPDLDAFFITLTSSGANYGMYMIATANAANTIPMKISQNIKNALALQMIDNSDFTYIVGKVSNPLPAIMGRGYAKGAPPLEFQTALPADGKDDKTVSDNIRRLAKHMATIWNGDLPEQIPEMPDSIPYGSIRTNMIALGLSLEKVQPVTYDCAIQHFLLISGTEQSGKSNLLQVVARQTKEKLGGKLYVFNIKGSGLSRLLDASDAYYTSASDIDAFVESLRPELQRRHEGKQTGRADSYEPIIIAIDDYSAFFKAVSNETIMRLLAIVKMGKGLDLYLIVAGDAYDLSGYSSKGEALTLALAKAKQAVMLGGCMNDHAAIPTKASYSQKSVPVREHEGMCVFNSECTLFKPIEIQGGIE